MEMMYNFDIAALDNFSTWHKFIPGTQSNRINGHKCDIKKLSETCNSAYQNIKAVYHPKLSEANLKRRLEIIAALLDTNIWRLTKHITHSPLSFNLLSCLNDLIFNRKWLHETKREILLSRSGYSDIYPFLSFKEIADKLNIRPKSLYLSEEIFKLKISELISGFKLIVPYIDYDNIFGLECNFVKISNDKCCSLKTRQSDQHLTPLFISEIVADTYKYDVIPLTHGKEDLLYCIKSGLTNKENIIRFFNWLKNEIDSFDQDLGSSTMVEFIEIFLHNEYPHPK